MPTAAIAADPPDSAGHHDPDAMLEILVEVREPKPRVKFPRSRDARWKGPSAEIDAMDRSRAVGGAGQIPVSVI